MELNMNLSFEEIMAKEVKQLKDNGYNSNQIVASSISGYDPHHSGAKDDYYHYHCHNETEKKDQIKEYADYVYNINVDEIDIQAIYNFLETYHDGDHEHYLAFKSLNKDWE